MADYEALKTAVITGKMAQVKELAQQALAAGANPQEILDQGLMPAMDIVGEKFSCQEFFIPEMLIAARAMLADIGILKPLLAAQGGKPRGKVVIGTVKGDLHDIGKNLVGLMLQCLAQMDGRLAALEFLAQCIDSPKRNVKCRSNQFEKQLQRCQTSFSGILRVPQEHFR